VGEVSGSGEYVEAGNEIEESLVEIWKEVLGLDRIGVLDNFFEIGGNSLTATKLLLRINRIFNINLSLEEIFINSNIRKTGSIIKNLDDQNIENLLDSIELGI
ncbi:MAG: hypothetical protein GY756_00700, partial [bacterium]|nr:hypothetical protein [bacterium]